MEQLPNLRSLGRPIAQGRTAELFAWGEGRVLKLFRPDWDERAAASEAEKARAVHAAGLPSPAVCEEVQLNGRAGIVYERIEGTSLLEILKDRPWRLRSVGRLLADLHHEVHEARVPTLPALPDCLARDIERASSLTPAERDTLLGMLARLPRGEAVCHGDFHPENVILTDHRGPVILDWNDATQGYPLADVARTALLIRGGAPPEGTPRRKTLELMRRLLLRTYLHRYVSRQRPDPGGWRAWQTVIAGARLAERIPGEERWLLGLVRAGLRRTLPRRRTR